MSISDSFKKHPFISSVVAGSAVAIAWSIVTGREDFSGEHEFSAIHEAGVKITDDEKREKVKSLIDRINDFPPWNELDWAKKRVMGDLVDGLWYEFRLKMPSDVIDYVFDNLRYDTNAAWGGRSQRKSNADVYRKIAMNKNSMNVAQQNRFLDIVLPLSNDNDWRDKDAISCFMKKYVITDEQKMKFFRAGKRMEKIVNMSDDLPEEIKSVIIEGALEGNRSHQAYVPGILEKTKLFPHQIQKFLDSGVSLDAIYKTQKLSKRQIEQAIEKGASLIEIIKNQNLKKDNIKSIADIMFEKFEKGEFGYSNKSSFFAFLKDTTFPPSVMNEVLDRLLGFHRLMKGSGLRDINANDFATAFRSFVEGQRFDSDTITKILEETYPIEALPNLYSNERSEFNSEQIDYILRRRLYLANFYSRVEMSEEELNRAVRIGGTSELKSLFSSSKQVKFSPRLMAWIIRSERGDIVQNLGQFYSSHEMPKRVVSLAMEKGVALHQLFEKQRLTPSQLERAIELGAELENLLAYQDLPPKYIDLIIERGIRSELEKLYTKQDMLDYQRDALLEKLGIDPNAMRGLPESLRNAILPKNIVKFAEYMQESIDKKIDENPLKDIVGDYAVVPKEWAQIEDFLREKGYSTKADDTRYAYKTENGVDKDFQIGVILHKSQNESEHAKNMLAIYNRIQQAGMPEGNFTVVISQNPLDIARKSTGQSWNSCETIANTYAGWPPNCGWCDDISANNVIGYIVDNDNPDKWLGRCMIRWCIRADNQKVDAVVENYYGNTKYHNLLYDNLMKIVTEAGYSGVPGAGNVTCKTPYPYSGYVDFFKSKGYPNGIPYTVR